MGIACNCSSCVFDAAEYSGAALRTERNALPSATPVDPDGGPTILPLTKVPPGEDTTVTFGTRDSRAA